MSSTHDKYPSTEVSPRASRRRFTAAYKRQIVEEAAQCSHGEIGSLLQHEIIEDIQMPQYEWSPVDPNMLIIQDIGTHLRFLNTS